MIQILFYCLLSLAVLCLGGLGLSVILLPKSLKPYSLLLSPWVFLVISNLLLMTFGRFGLPVKISMWLILFLVCFYDYLFVSQKKAKLIFCGFNYPLHFAAWVCAAVAFTLSMLPIIKHQSLTSYSLGNNDIVNYVVVAEYFVDHPIMKKVSDTDLSRNAMLGAVGTFVDYGYRWGSPLLFAFFYRLLGLEAYQASHLFICVLYALSVPLASLAFCQLCPSQVKPHHKAFLSLLVSLMYAANVNNLYYIYHGFMAQFLSNGLLIGIFILFIDVFQTNERLHLPFYRYFRSEALIGLFFFAILAVYHEQIVFIVLPLAIYVLLQGIIQRNWQKFQILLAGGIMGALIFPRYTLSAAKFQLKITNLFNEPIGWELFRYPNPYPNLLETIGLWSLHKLPPLPTILVYIAGLVVAICLIIGIVISRHKWLAFSLLFFYSFCLYYFLFTKPNFFSYYRVIGYSLWFWLVIFVLGLYRSLKVFAHKLTIILVSPILIFFVFFSSFFLIKSSFYSNLVVNDKLSSLRILNHSSVSEPIFTHDALTDNYPLWYRFWTLAFLKNKHVITTDNIAFSYSLLHEGSLYLADKNYPPLMPITETVWENNSWRLGRICLSDSCVFSLGPDFVNINFNHWNNQIMLTRGWGAYQPGFRLMEQEAASVRFVNHMPVKFINVSFASLDSPLSVDMMLDGKKITTLIADPKLHEHRIMVKEGISSGVHYLLFRIREDRDPSGLNTNVDDPKHPLVKFTKIQID